MGFLKHVVFPAYVLMHGFLVALTVTGNKEQFPVIAKYPVGEGGLTVLEEHLIVCVILATQAAFLVGCILGFFFENSHFRGILVVMELIFWVVDWGDCYMRGLNGAAPLAMTVLSTLGLLTHAMEPGLFTKDKEKAKRG